MVGEVRLDLLTQLKNPDALIETQEKIIEQLIKLNETEDPCWFYLNYHYQYILEEMYKTYDLFRSTMETHISHHHTMCMHDEAQNRGS